MTDKMKAVILTKACTAQEMTVTDIPVPSVRPGWVLVRIHAAGLNHSEVLLRLYEIDHDYIRKPIVPGIECVGEVADASDTDLQKGQTVVALMGGMGRSFNGSYAEYALLPRKNVFAVSRGDLTWEQLAAVPETFFTAWGSLHECLLLAEGDTLLVRGATSTVGLAAIQLGKAAGARVIAAARRESSFGQLKAIGADECVIDDGNISRQPLGSRPNKVLELIGPKTLHDSFLTVSRPGYVCNTGDLGGIYSLRSFDPIKDIPNGVFLSGFFSNYPTQQTIDAIFRLIGEHGIKPLYARTFSIDDIAQAHELLEKGGAGGKIILTM